MSIGVNSLASSASSIDSSTAIADPAPPISSTRSHRTGLAPIATLAVAIWPARSILSSADLPTLSGVSRANTSHAGHSFTVELDDHVADENACRASRSVGIDADDHDCASVGQRERRSQGFVETNAMQANAQISAPNAAVREQLGSNTLDR